MEPAVLRNTCQFMFWSNELITYKTDAVSEKNDVEWTTMVRMMKGLMKTQPVGKGTWRLQSLKT